MSSATETINVTTSVAAEGQIRLPLAQIDNTVFPNSRRGFGEVVAMRELCESLANRQMQNVTIAWHKKGDKMVAALVAGFRRHEAFTRNALYDLAKKHNKEKDLKPGTEGHVDVAKPEHRDNLKALYPVEYQAALEAIMVDCKSIVLEDDVDAEVANLDENYNRQDISTGDLLNKISSLVTRGVQQNRIAKGMGCHKSKISQLVKVGSVRKVLTERLISPSDVPVDKHPQHNDLANAMLNEYDRRLAINSKYDEQGIPFSHVRDLAYALDKKDAEGLNTEGLMHVLKGLTRVDKGGNITTQKMMDYGVFKELIANGVKISQPLAKQDAEVQTDGEGVAATDTEKSIAAEASALVKAAADQAAAKAAAPGTVPAGDATVSKQAADIATTQAANLAAGEGVADEMASLDGEDGDLGSEDLDVGDLGDLGELGEPSTAELKALETSSTSKEAKPVPGNEAEAGAKKGATTAPVEDRFRNAMDYTAVEEHARDNYTAAIAEGTDTHLIERMSMLNVASYLYMALGLNAEDEAVKEKYEVAFTAVANYYDGLEKYAAEVAPLAVKHGFSAFKMERPKVA